MKQAAQHRPKAMSMSMSVSNMKARPQTTMQTHYQAYASPQKSTRQAEVKSSFYGAKAPVPKASAAKSMSPMKKPMARAVHRHIDGNDVILKIREKIKSRGARGIMGIGRSFRIYDDNGDRHLDIDEMTKAINEMRLGLTDEERRSAIRIADRDGDGYVDYEEFLRLVRGDMNEFRKRLAMKAFDIMDKDKSGVIDILDIKHVYNASKHPDFIAGKKTEDEVLWEFLDTFEQHHVPNQHSKRDGNVDKDEWIEYYNNVSMSIDDDRYFELMMTRCWNMDGSLDVNKRKGAAFQF